MKIAVITPYYNEPLATIERCVDSVHAQTVSVDHILVADGQPLTWLGCLTWLRCRHVVLDKSHGDYGNTPRAIGALLAASEGYDAIAFLDADCWLEPCHIERMVAALEGHDYVVGTRILRRLDGTVMPISTEAHEDHADTNCLLLGRACFPLLSVWALMPRELAVVGDRVFYHALKSAGLKRAICHEPTVNYTCTWASVYRVLGEEPPLPLKENPDHSGIQAWIAGLSDLDRVNALIQCDVRTLYAAPKAAGTVVASFYADNIDPAMVAAQRAVVERFLPDGWKFYQFPLSTTHGDAIDMLLSGTNFDTYVFLDIDCIPLTSDALTTLQHFADQGAVIGCAQRANHIENGGHLYAGPFCVAFRRETWITAGRPSFRETERGDVGEELTWACEERGIPVELLRPSRVPVPRWELRGEARFGPGAEYAGRFYHQFEARHGADAFLRRCAEVLTLELAA